MNNYILNSGTCSYNNHSYNYIETNNYYICPYVFMTNDDVAQKYVYFESMPINSGYGAMGYKDYNGIEQMGPVPIYYDGIKARGVATIKEAAEIGETTSDSNQLIIKNSLGNYNCQLKDITTIEYDSDNQCINYDDIEKKPTPEPDMFIYTIIIEHNTGFLIENSTNIICAKNEQDSGWQNDDNPQKYNDSIRSNIDLIIYGAQYGHFGDIIKPLAPASEGRYYTYDTFTNMYYNYQLYSNNTCTYSWGFNSNREGNKDGTTADMTCFVGNIVPPSGESFDGKATVVSAALYFEKEYTNATINGKTIKLQLNVI